MTQTVIYPRLYRTMVPGPDATLNSRGDQSVAELYAIYEKGMQDTSNLNYRLKVLDCAVRLFGEFSEWMKLQRNNPNLNGYNLEFLRDSMRFITQGHREMSPLIWCDLLSERDEHVTAAHHLTMEELHIPEELSTAKILQLWCSHPRGFEDLLQTLNVLFGPSRGEDR